MAPAMPAEGVKAAMRMREDVGREREVLAKSIAVEVRVEKAAKTNEVSSMDMAYSISSLNLPSLSRNQAAKKTKVGGNRLHSRSIRNKPLQPSAIPFPTLFLPSLVLRKSLRGSACGLNHIRAAVR